MFRKIRYSVPILPLLLCLTCGARNLESDNAQVSVSLYNNANVPLNELQRAEQSTSRVFQMAGISVLWRNCEEVPRRSSLNRDCADSLFHDFSIRVVPHSLTLTDSVFGASFLDQDGSGAYGDVFYDNAQRLTDTAHLSLGDVLGHVIAHELGHLLLGKDAHSPAGIMRPHWSKEELQSLAMGRLLFTAQQGLLMKDRLRHGPVLAHDSRHTNVELVSRSR